MYQRTLANYHHRPWLNLTQPTVRLTHKTYLVLRSSTQLTGAKQAARGHVLDLKLVPVGQLDKTGRTRTRGCEVRNQKVTWRVCSGWVLSPALPRREDSGEQDFQTAAQRAAVSGSAVPSRQSNPFCPSPRKGRRPCKGSQTTVSTRSLWLGDRLGKLSSSLCIGRQLLEDLPPPRQLLALHRQRDLLKRVRKHKYACHGGLRQKFGGRICVHAANRKKTAISVKNKAKITQKRVLQHNQDIHLPLPDGSRTTFQDWRIAKRGFSPSPAISPDHITPSTTHQLPETSWSGR